MQFLLIVITFEGANLLQILLNFFNLFFNITFCFKLFLLIIFIKNSNFCFQIAKGQWCLDELSKLMQMPPTILRRKMNFWISYGLIAEIASDYYQLIEESKNVNDSTHGELVVEDELESVMASTHDQREEGLQVIFCIDK